MDAVPRVAAKIARWEKTMTIMLVGLKLLTRTMIVMLLVGGILTANYGPVMASSESEKTEMIERAKKEGKVMVYTTTAVPVLQELHAAFKKKYPFLEINIYRSEAKNLLARAQLEYNAARHMVDVFSAPFWGTEWFYEGGLLGLYKSPEREFIQDFCKDKEGYATGDYINIGIIAYNTKLVPPDKVPKSYQDFLDPWWKGKMALDDNGLWWYGPMLEILGAEKGRGYMQKMAQQNINIRRGQALKVQLLAAGEFFAVINAFNYHVEFLKKNGAQVDWVAPLDQPTIPNIHSIAIAKNPSSPNAARLYIDFILSREAQQIFARFNSVPTRVDVAPTPSRLMLGSDGKKLRFLSMDFPMIKRINSLQKEFRQIFMKGR